MVSIKKLSFDWYCLFKEFNNASTISFCNQMYDFFNFNLIVIYFLDHQRIILGETMGQMKLRVATPHPHHQYKHKSLKNRIQAKLHLLIRMIVTLPIWVFQGIFLHLIYQWAPQVCLILLLSAVVAATQMWVCVLILLL